MKNKLLMTVGVMKREVMKVGKKMTVTMVVTVKTKVELTLLRSTKRLWKN